jgi:hypothetical protein
MLYIAVSYIMSRVAQLVEHGACNNRVVSLIPMEDQYNNVCTHYCTLLSIRVSAK